MKTTFYLARHGQSEASIKGIVQGIGLNIPLAEEGKKQNEILAENLKDYNFDIIFSSTAIRSSETAETIGKYHSKTPIIKIAELNERSKGKTEGMLKTEFAKEFPDIINKWNKEIDVRVADGENYEDVEKRVIPVMKEHLRNYTGKNILYAIHGNVIRVMLGYILDIPYGKRARIKQDYCAFNIVTYDHERNRWEILLVNRVF